MHMCMNQLPSLNFQTIRGVISINTCSACKQELFYVRSSTASNSCSYFTGSFACMVAAHVHLPWTRVPCTFTVIFILPNVRQLIADPKK